MAYDYKISQNFMRLKCYRVWNFRSVDDSGPIEVDGVTALIGTNESGKTNLLLPLWKFNPAKDGAIIPTADYPRKKYNDFRNLEQKPEFIEAIFSVDDDLAKELGTLTGYPPEMFAEVRFVDHLDKRRSLSFFQVKPEPEILSGEVVKLLERARLDLEGSTALKNESELKLAMCASIIEAIHNVKALTIINPNHFDLIDSILILMPRLGYPDRPSLPASGACATT